MPNLRNAERIKSTADVSCWTRIRLNVTSALGEKSLKMSKDNVNFAKTGYNTLNFKHGFWWIDS
jgi:hypothetical protein